MKPFLRVCTPSTRLNHCAPLSLAILWSSRMAQVLFLASWVLPGPTWCSLAKRQSTWALTATIESRLLIWPTKRPRNCPVVDLLTVWKCPCCIGQIHVVNVLSSGQIHAVLWSLSFIPMDHVDMYLFQFHGMVSCLTDIMTLISVVLFSNNL